MNYDEKRVFDLIKYYYPIELDYKDENWKEGKFFKKELENEFLAINYQANKEYFIVYLFKSDHYLNNEKFQYDFDLGSIFFRIDDLQTLKIILEANRGQSTKRKK